MCNMRMFGYILFFYKDCRIELHAQLSLIIFVWTVNNGVFFPAMHAKIFKVSEANFKPKEWMFMMYNHAYEHLSRLIFHRMKNDYHLFTSRNTSRRNITTHSELLPMTYYTLEVLKI
jgi:hypothetical protein